MQKKPTALAGKSLLGQKSKKQIFPRANLRGHVLIHDDNHLFIVPLNNLSAGGLFVDQLTHFNAGSQVHLVVKSKDLDAPVQADGKVVRVETDRRKGIAVEFCELSEQAKNTIQNCVLQRRVQKILNAA